MKDVLSPIFISGTAALTFASHSGFPAYPADALAASSQMTAALAGLLFLGKKWRLCYVFLAIALVLTFGQRYCCSRDSFMAAQETRFPADEVVQLTGRLSDFPEVHPEGSRLLIRTRSFQIARSEFRKALNIQIWLAGDASFLNRGDTIQIYTSVYSLNLHKNFYPFPAEQAALYRQIHFRGRCKSILLVRVLKPAPFYWRWLGAWRRRIRAAIQSRFGNRGQLGEKGVFLEATILGDRSRLDPRTREELIASGAYHLIAISGGNVAIIAVLSLLALKKAGMRRQRRTIACSLLLLLFLAVSGFEITAQRAVWMALFAFTGAALYLSVRPLNLLSGSGIVLLTCSPTVFLDPAFILSFALTAAVIHGRELFRSGLTFLPNFLAELLSALLASALVALPLSLHFFNRYAPAGILSGLLLIPLASVITTVGALLIPLAPLSSSLSAALLAAGDFPLSFFFAVTRFFSRHLDWTLYRAAPPLWLVAAILFSFFCWRRNGRSWLQRLAAPLAWLLLTTATVIHWGPPGNRHLEVTFLDVGQGDSQLVVFPGSQALLIDGGGSWRPGFEVGRQIVLPFLLQKKVRIRWLALSHCHPDHLRGILEIMAILQPEELWIASAPREEELFTALMTALPRRTRVVEVSAGFDRHISDCTVRCLYPDRIIRPLRTANNHSLVLRISDSCHSFLFSGDIDDDAERELLDRLETPALRSDVLKIPHHGSRSASSPEFVAAVHPHVGILSLALRNVFGFPHRDTLRTYRQQGVRLLSTSIRGGIRVISLPQGLAIETSK